MTEVSRTAEPVNLICVVLSVLGGIAITLTVSLGEIIFLLFINSYNGIVDRLSSWLPPLNRWIPIPLIIIAVLNVVQCLYRDCVKARLGKSEHQS
jgi:hypothetical protein